MPDETQDPKPHVHVGEVPEKGMSLSIWFFCGILMLAYGVVLVVQGLLELHHPPPTVLANLQPTLWWGVVLSLFGGFYTVRFRPGKG